jgi:histidine triad (HIT) family protein
MPEACDFCAIARGEGTATLVADGPDWVAFFPLDPATTGHTLIVPRSHVSDYWHADPSLVSSLATAALELGHAIQNTLSPDGMNLITSSGSAAEQSVFHLHLHLVPRWKSDGFGAIWPPVGHAAPDRVLDDVADTLRTAFRSIKQDTKGP